MFLILDQPAPPAITSFAPSSGAVGSEIRIYGSGFAGLTGATVGGVALSGFAVISDSEVRGTIAAGTPTGRVVAGTATSATDFVVTVGGASSATQEFETQRFLSRTRGNYSSTEIAAINTFFADLRSSGVLQKLELLWLPGIAKTYYDATQNQLDVYLPIIPGPGISFTSLQGLLFTAGSASVNYNPSVLGGAAKIFRGDSHLGIYTLAQSNFVGANFAQAGAMRIWEPGAGAVALIYPSLDSLAQATLETSGAGGTYIGGPTATGLHQLNRIGNNYSYRVGSGLVGSNTSAPLGFHNTILRFGTWTGRLGAASVGAGLSATEAVAFNTALSALFTAFGTT